MIAVDQALVSSFIDAGFGLPIAHENAPHDPDGTPFVALQVLQNPLQPFDISDTDEVTGLFQFDLRYPAGTGAIPAKSKRSQIFAAYPIGRRLAYGGQEVMVTGKHAVSNRVDGGDYLVIGRILFTAWTARQ